MAWTKQQMLDAIDERTINWSWDAKIPILLSALSMVEEVPSEIRDQENKLSQALIKADLYCRYREAINFLTSNEVKIKIESSSSSITFSEAQIKGNEFPSKEIAIQAMIQEFNKIEKEISEFRIDYNGIIRFLRKRLK